MRAYYCNVGDVEPQLEVIHTMESEDTPADLIDREAEIAKAVVSQILSKFTELQSAVVHIRFGDQQLCIIPGSPNNPLEVSDVR